LTAVRKTMKSRVFGDCLLVNQVYTNSEKPLVFSAKVEKLHGVILRAEVVRWSRFAESVHGSKVTDGS